MNTDRFTDLIRRKLDSIRPEFQEKDWTRMQESLRQAGLSQPDADGAVRPLWGGSGLRRSWLLAAASLSSVVLLAYSAWQRTEINQLRETVAQFSRPAASRPARPSAATPDQLTTPRAEPSAAPDGRLQAAQPDQSRTEAAAGPNQPSVRESVRTDTVYITRYVRVPASPRPAAEQPTKPLTPNTYDATSTQTQENNRVAGRPTRPNANGAARPLASRTTKTNLAQGVGPVGSSDARTEPGSGSAAGPTSEAAADYNLVTTRPLATEFIDWNARLAQRAKRIRPTRSSAPEAVAQAPASQPVDPVRIGGRVGIGTDLVGPVWSAGLAGEVLLGNHWTIGLGLSRSAYYGGEFLTDYDFDERTKRNFRREFAPSMDPKRDILNISRRVNRLQVPLSVGYRIPISPSLSVLPSVGTYLNLSSRETITFYSREAPRIFPIPSNPGRPQKYSEVNFSEKRPVGLFDTFTYGLSLDWQRGHWAAQAGPLLTVPTQLVTTWHRETSFGLRARVYYRF